MTYHDTQFIKLIQISNPDSKLKIDMSFQFSLGPSGQIPGVNGFTPVAQAKSSTISLNIGSTQNVQAGPQNWLGQPIQSTLTINPTQINPNPINLSNMLNSNAPSQNGQINLGGLFNQNMQNNPSQTPQSLQIGQGAQTNLPGDNYTLQFHNQEVQFSRMDLRQHIREKPDTYIGGRSSYPRKFRVYDPAAKKFFTIMLTVPQGLINIVREVLDNAFDNNPRSIERNQPMSGVQVQLTQHSISVSNDGCAFPLVFDEKEQMYTPQLVFGNLLTSGNYGNGQLITTGGKNGFGAKLANINSIRFIVTIIDMERSMKYTQIWENQMTVCHPPILEQLAIKPNGNLIKVEFYPDFAYFGLTEFPPEFIGIVSRLIADATFTSKCPCQVQYQQEPSLCNTITIDLSKPKVYLEALIGLKTTEGESRNIFTHYEWPLGIPMKQGKKNGQMVPENLKIIPTVEMVVVDYPDAGIPDNFPEGNIMAWVNGLWTPDGGVHVDVLTKILADTAIAIVNGTADLKKQDKKKAKTKLSLKSKAKEAAKPKKEGANQRKYQLNRSDALRHVLVLISCRLPNPEFTSQTKTKLIKPVPPCTITANDLSCIQKWQLSDRLYLELEVKRFRVVSENDQKRKKRINVPKLKDAHMAETDQGYQCTLILTEGDSAAGWALRWISRIPEGRKWFGILPLRGKVLNVSDVSVVQIAENKEIAGIKEATGWVEGIDYRDINEYRKLRYGKYMIMADPDVDGHHIKGLVLNILKERWPSLLMLGTALFMRIPVIRLTKGKELVRLYSDEEYKQWRQSVPNPDSWSHKYVKGLGTNSTKELEADIINPLMVNFVFDQYTMAAFNLAFKKRFCSNRKAWIEQYEPHLGFERMTQLPFSTFIDQELITFVIEDNNRSIPGWDGLKPSQRKIIETCFRFWKRQVGSDKASTIKVAQLAAKTSEGMEYHYGEGSLEGAIMLMAQRFIGANNLPYLVEDGQFGTYYYGGEDAAAPRYPYTRPEWWWPYMYLKADQDLLDYLVDDGHKIEPRVYLPILPMMMINGALGIGFGHSSFIPPFHPLELVEWYRHRIYRDRPELKNALTSNVQGTFQFSLSDKPIENATVLNPETSLPYIEPWYRDFVGDVYLKTRTRKASREIQEELEDVDPNDPLGSDKVVLEELSNIDSSNASSVITYGTFRIISPTTVIVESLPIGRWPASYEEWLKILKENKLIGNFVDNSTDSAAYFEITGLTFKPTHKSLRLKRTFGITNMVIMNEQKKPIRFKSIDDLLEQFYNWRLGYYDKRKGVMIKRLEEEIHKLSEKARFIRAILDKQIKYKNVSKDDIYAKMDQMNFDRSLLTTVTLAGLSIDDVAVLLAQTEKIKQELNKVIQMSHYQLWLTDLNEFREAYLKHYRDDRPTRKIQNKVGLSGSITPVDSTILENLAKAESLKQSRMTIQLGPIGQPSSNGHVTLLLNNSVNSFSNSVQ